MEKKITNFIFSLLLLTNKNFVFGETYAGYCETEYSDYSGGTNALCIQCNTNDDCPTGRGCWAYTMCNDMYACGDPECPNASPSPTPSAVSPTPSITPGFEFNAPPFIGKFRRVAYFENWAQYRGEPYTFYASNINTTKVTHMIYAFAIISSGYEVQVTEYNDVANFAIFNGMKTNNLSLKTMIAIGGWDYSITTNIMPTMIANPSYRATCVQSIIQFCAQYGFDGVDIDWEYPGFDEASGTPNDKENFAIFLNELREAAPQGFLISVAVAGGIPKSEVAYDRLLIEQAVDFINLMTYDMYLTDTLSPHSALNNANYTIMEIVDWWLEVITEPRKLNVGIPSYARTSTYPFSGNASYGMPRTGYGPAGPYTGQDGFLGYYEVEAFDKLSTTTVVFDTPTTTVYSYGNYFFATYDTPETVAIKLEYINATGLGGAMMWSFGLDDFLNGSPILTAIDDGLSNYDYNISSSITPTTSASTTQSHTPTRTSTPSHTQTVSPTKSPTNSKSSTPSVTSTATNTVTATTSRTSTPTHTSTTTTTMTPTQTVTNTRTITSSSSPTITPTATATNSKSSTPSVTSTVTNTVTETASKTVTPTHTSTTTTTMTPTQTATYSRSMTSSSSPTETPTTTATNSKSKTPTETASKTLTPTHSSTTTTTMTPTQTATHSRTITTTSSPTETPTATATNTKSKTSTTTTTVTPTHSKTPTRKN